MYSLNYNKICITKIDCQFTLPTAEKNSSKSLARIRWDNCMQNTVRASRSSTVISVNCFLTGVGDRRPRLRSRSFPPFGLRDRFLPSRWGLRDFRRESRGLRERRRSRLRLRRRSRSLRSRLRLLCLSLRPDRRSLSLSFSRSLSFPRSLSLSRSFSFSRSFSLSRSLSVFFSFASLREM